VVATTAIGYYRFHGISRLYYSEYDIPYLQKIANSMLQQKRLKSMYCYFNNTAALGAIANARWIEQYVKTGQT
jgi:uncharacterized protein YecE (DUF72 family)